MSAKDLDRILSDCSMNGYELPPYAQYLLNDINGACTITQESYKIDASLRRRYVVTFLNEQAVEEYLKATNYQHSDGNKVYYGPPPLTRMVFQSKRYFVLTPGVYTFELIPDTSDFCIGVNMTATTNRKCLWVTLQQGTEPQDRLIDEEMNVYVSVVQGRGDLRVLSKADSTGIFVRLTP